MRRRMAAFLVAAAMAIPLAAAAANDAAVPDKSALYLKVQLANPVKVPKLKPSEVIEGILARDVYSANQKVLSAGSVVHLTVDHLEKRPRPRNDHWPWVVNAFTPRHENYPVFKTAVVSQTTGESTLHVSLISVTHMREVHAQARKAKAGEPRSGEEGAVEVSKPVVKKSPTATMVLEAFSSQELELADEGTGRLADSATTLPAATRCRILLLGNVSASKSKPGDPIRARLLEPVLVNSKVVLPAGSLFEGKIVRRTPPRLLSRAGSLYFTFTELTLPGDSPVAIAASLAGAELDRQSHTRMDSEGQFHGERAGKAWMAINLGVSAGIAKVGDDTLQLVIEAIVSTATDASTAGTGRIVAACASGLFMATRHGRDVIIPRFTEMEISLDRSVVVNASLHPQNHASSAGGN